jgi:hypothetical protein
LFWKTSLENSGFGKRVQKCANPLVLETSWKIIYFVEKKATVIKSKYGSFQNDNYQKWQFPKS